MTIRSWLFVLVLSISAMLGSRRALAQQPPRVTIENVPLSPKMVSRATWDANAFYQIYKQRSYENLVLLFVATQAYRNNPNLDPNVELASLNKLHAEYTQRHSDANGNYHLPEDAVQAAQSMLNLAGSYGGAYAKAAKPLADEILKWGVKGYESYQKGPQQIAAQRYLSETASYSELLGRYVDDAWTLSDGNKNAREVIKTYFGSIFNADPGDSAATIRQKNPDFKLSNDVDSLLGSSLDNKLSIDQLRSAVETHNKHLAVELGNVRKELADLDKAQTAYFAAVTEEERKRIFAEQEKARYEINIEGARSSVYLLSVFATFANNPGLARAINVTGTSTIQIIDAVQKYNATISVTTTSLSKIASSVTLAATWVGAGLAIASLMQPGGSSDQIIMEQLNAIRQQLVLLRQEMHDRFDRIDLKLNQLFEVMGNQFDVLVSLLNNQQVSLGEISAATARLDQGLLELNLGLTSLEARLDDYIKAAFDRELDKQLKLCFTPLQRMNQQEFNKCLFNLRYQALDVTLDPLRVSAVDDQTIFNVSAIRPLPASYVYMAKLGGERFQDKEMQSLENHLANPVEWSFAVDAYLGLAQEWPQYHKNVSSTDLDDMREAGVTLKKMATASRRAGLYDALFANYQAKLDSLRLKINSAEDQYALSHSPGGNPFRRGPKLFKYALPAAIKQGSMLPCPWRSENYTTSTQALAIPAGIERFLPADYWMADNMEIAKLQICYEVPGYYEERSSKVSVPLPFNQGIFQFYQAPAVRIEVYMMDPQDNRSILTAFDRQVTSAKPVYWGYKLITDTQPGRYLTDQGKDPSGNAARAWQSELRDEFINDSTEKFPDWTQNFAKESSTTKVDELLEKKFDGLTNNFYQTLLQSFKSSDPIGVAARELSSAKIMIQSFLSIGYGEALDQDEAYRSLIFGNASIPNGEDIEYSFSDVFQGPRAKMRKESLDALKEMKIEPSKQALIDNVKAGKFRAVFRLLALGYWDGLNQAERASLMQDAKSDFIVYAMLQDIDKNGFDYRYRKQEAALSLKPYDFMGKVADDRLKSLSQKVKDHNSDRFRFPMIDDTLDRLSLFAQFYVNAPIAAH